MSTVHVFTPWSTPRFVPLQYRNQQEPPAFFIVFSRVCRGRHDTSCREVQVNTMGPFLLAEPSTPVWQCPTCRRLQPSRETGLGHDDQICLYCSQNAASLAIQEDSRRSVRAVATLTAAAGALQLVRTTDPGAAGTLLAECDESVRVVFEHTAALITADHARAEQAGVRVITDMARVVQANAHRYAGLPTAELLPVTVEDDEA